MAESTFVTVTAYSGDGDDAKTIGEPEARFERWLSREKYQLAVDVCPYNSREGGYQMAKDAIDVLDEYLADHPREERYADQLAKRAADIGLISNFW